MKGLSLGVTCLALMAALGCGGKTTNSSSNNNLGDGDGPGTGGDDDQVTGGGGALSVRIVRPNGNAAVLAGAPVIFEAEFTYGSSRIQPATITWTSDGLFLGDTNPLDAATLTAGQHTIAVSTTYAGETASDSIIVTAGDFEVRIVSPAAGAVLEVGSTVDLVSDARVSDGTTITTLVSGAPGGGERTASFAWSSSIDGALGGQASVSASTLSLGEHTITVTVTDDGTGGTGKSGSATIALVIAPPNTAPVVSITSPASCPADLEQGQTLSFAGTVSDAEEPNLTGEWIDLLTGDVGEGSSYTLGVAAPLGKHEIVLRATDVRGASDTDSCVIYVVPAGGDRGALFPATPAVNDNLVGNNQDVRWIGSDGAGHTWIGNDEGVAVFDANQTALGAYDGAALGVSGDVAQINGADVANGDAFIATDEGLARCDYAAGVLSSCAEVSNGDFEAVAVSADGSLVIAARDGGLFLASYAGGNLQGSVLAHDGNSNLPGNQVNDVLLVGSVAYAATDDGLCVVSEPLSAIADPEQLCSTILDPDNSILPSSEVRALAEAGGGAIWIGTDEGLVRYDPATGASISYDEASGLGDDRVNDVVVDEDGIVWIATNGGVSRLDPATGAISNFDGTDFGTPGDDRVRSIFIDADGVKWFATESGVIRYTGI